MIFLTLHAFASDSGLQRMFDRSIACEHGVDPAADASSCKVVPKAGAPDDDRPTWSVATAAPGRLFVGYSMPAVDWGHVYRLDVKRAFDPVLLSVGVSDDSEACPDERWMYAHILSQRGPLTHQVCAQFTTDGEGEVLLDATRALPTDQWVPIWGYHGKDASKSDIKQWFIVQLFVATKGQTPDRPAQHPYDSVAALRAAIPTPVAAKPLQVLAEPMRPEPATDEDG